MKTQNINIYMLLLGMVLALFACQPDEFSLEKAILKKDLDYSITQNQDEPNMVILENMTQKVAPVWSTPLGRSFLPRDTVRLAFPGDYKFVYGAQSAGGFVQDDTVTVSISTFNFTYLEHPYWALLTGGPGESKTWVLDVDENGSSKYFTGPLYFAGPDFSWEWNPDWQSWAMPKGPYGTMTFDLKGTPNFTVDNLVLGVQGSGTFMLYPNENQLQIFGAEILHDTDQWDAVDDKTGRMMIRMLTEDQLQLITVANGGELWLTWNFITLDYYNSH